MSLPPTLQNRLSIPMMDSPLFIISNLDLVIAQCKAGVVGSFPASNARPAKPLKTWLQRITTELAEYDTQHPDGPSVPSAVNQIVHKSNDRLERNPELYVKYKVPIVVTSLGARESVNQTVRNYGGIVLHDVIDSKLTKKAIEKGTDGPIAVTAGVNSHAGTASPSALIHEIHEWFGDPLLLSGAITSGNAILTTLAAGTDLAYVGSTFITAEEANAVEGCKRAIVESTAGDIVYTSLFTGVRGNYLRKSTEGVGLDPDALPESGPGKVNFGSGGGAKTKAWRDIWGTGQGVSTVKRVVPTTKLTRRSTEGFEMAHRRLNSIEALRTVAGNRATA